MDRTEPEGAPSRDDARFERASIDPRVIGDDTIVYDLVSRAREFLRTGHPHQAAMLLGRAKLMEPEKGSIRETLGRALYLAGRATRARREFAKAVQIDPVNDYAHFGLALCCARTGQRTRAIAHLKLAIAMRPGADEYRDALARIAG